MKLPNIYKALLLLSITCMSLVVLPAAPVLAEGDACTVLDPTCPAGEVCDIPNGSESGVCITQPANVTYTCSVDNYCAYDENATSCPQDCGCNSNGTCEIARGENADTCVADCACADDGVCNLWERGRCDDSTNYGNCGCNDDGVCSLSTERYCSDCTDGQCNADGICDEGENAYTCRQDCNGGNTCNQGMDSFNEVEGATPGSDGICDTFGIYGDFEDEFSCPEDCTTGITVDTGNTPVLNGPVCGDLICETVRVSASNPFSSPGYQDVTENCAVDCGVCSTPTIVETCGDGCEAAESPVKDVIFVVDTSNSMGGFVGGSAPGENRHKLTVAKTIVKYYMDTQMDLTADRIALLEFNGIETQNRTTLAYDLATVHTGNFYSALGGLEFEGGTNIGEVIKRLDSEFTNNPAWQPVNGNQQIVVLISDGDPTVGDWENGCTGFDEACSLEYAIDEADDFHTNHPDVLTYAVGFDLDALGATQQSEALDVLANHIASTPAQFFNAPANYNSEEVCPNQDSTDSIFHFLRTEVSCEASCDEIEIDGQCGDIFDTTIYDYNNSGDAINIDTPGLCDTGLVDNFAYSEISHMWTWTCEGEGVGASVGCNTFESYCGDGMVGTGVGYTDQEQCDDGNDNNNDDCLNTCVVATCSDGYTRNEQNGTEECDDGGKGESNTCSNTCMLPEVEPACGDGVQDIGEECDDGNDNNNDDCLNSCMSPVCGDGTIYNDGAGGEECDMGGLNSDSSPDTCRTDCSEPVCGDGVQDSGEQCDDGNTNNNDDCLDTCMSPVCGDGTIYNEGTGGEECDMGGLNSDTVPDMCRTDCSEPVCGDGVQDGGEECDDGNDNNNDDCLDTCKAPTCGDGIVWNEQSGTEVCDDANPTLCTDSCELPPVVAVCGNGILEADEMCDLGTDNSYNGDCLESCELPTCGDGFIWNEGTGTESCDDRNTNNNDDCLDTCVVATCTDGYTRNEQSGTEQCDDGDSNDANACSNSCELLVVGPTCGDGVQDSGEECDDGNDNNNDDCLNSCMSPVCGDGTIYNDGAGGEECDMGGLNSDSSPDTCRTDCSEPVCGDGVQDSGEECDDGNDNNNDDCLDTCVVATCTDGYTRNEQNGTEQCDDGDSNDANACSNSCELLVVGPRCGNGVQDGGEECDDGNDNNNDDCLNSCLIPTCGDGFAWDEGTGTEVCDDGNDSNTDVCTNSCIPNVCGDTYIGPGEICDDGNTDDMDGCYGVGSTTGTPCSPTSCGDSIVQQSNGDGISEQCDDGKNGDDTDGCLDTCAQTTCGDGIVQIQNGTAIGGTDGIGNEECDAGGLNSDDTPDACRSSCIEASCGDMVVDTGEECDDGNTDEFDGCLSTCEVQYCSIQGFVYLDIENNDLLDDGSDVGINSIQVVATDGDGVITTTTTVSDPTGEGYYVFDTLDCMQNYTVTYVNTTTYLSDSGQYEYDTPTQSPVSIEVPFASFYGDPMYTSPENNFGLVGYDLSVVKTVNTVDTQINGALEIVDGTAVQYALTFTNQGPTTAYDVMVIDDFLADQLTVTNIELGTLTAPVTSTDSSITIGPIPSLAAGEVYTILVDATVTGTANESIRNTVGVYTPDGLNDLIEQNDPDQFANNEYTAEVVVEGTCVIDGYMYIDNNDNGQYDAGSDTPIASGVEIIVIDSNGMSVDLLGESTIATTSTDGFYSVPNLDCNETYTVTYDPSSVENDPSHSEFEQDTTQSNPIIVTITPDAFDEDVDNTTQISPDNNFALDAIVPEVVFGGSSSSVSTFVTPVRCGDGIVNQFNEQCDDGNRNNEDECTTSCKPPVIPVVTSTQYTPPSVTPPVVTILPTLQEPLEPAVLDPDVTSYIRNFLAVAPEQEGRHSFTGIPQYLRTGVPLEEGRKNHGIKLITNDNVQTDAPRWGVSHGDVYPTDLQYRLDTVLLPYDSDAGDRDMYVLLPQAGYLIPVAIPQAGTEEYDLLREGQFVDLKTQLQDEFAQGGVHHAGSVLPGELGRNVVALHSSWFKDQPGKYEEGKYPTVGQLLTTVEPGDEVIYYLKEGNEYQQYTYEVESMGEVETTDNDNLYPDYGYEAMLYTCTDYGTYDNRFLVKMKMKDVVQESVLLDTVFLPRSLKQKFDILFNTIYKYDDDKKIRLYNSVWSNMDETEAEGVVGWKLQGAMEYIRYKIVTDIYSR